MKTSDYVFASLVGVMLLVACVYLGIIIGTIRNIIPDNIPLDNFGNECVRIVGGDSIIIPADEPVVIDTTSGAKVYECADGTIRVR